MFEEKDNLEMFDEATKETKMVNAKEGIRMSIDDLF